MARPLPAILLLCLGSGLILLDPTPLAGAQDGGRPSSRQTPQYQGPTVLNDPNDPLQSVRWTLGITSPERMRLPQTRTGPARRTTDYDFEQRRVIVSYRAGEHEILPAVAMTGNQFAGESFGEGLRGGWIRGNQTVLKESLERGSGSGGLVNLSLPFELPFTSKLFGEGAPNLRVSGSEQITISGSSSWEVGRVTGERGGGSIFPKLDMRQRLNVNLQGTIGTKLFIDVAQNSDALTPLENSLKIRYRGEEDDVVQTVELGNTNLSLPATQFVSYSARQAGLFGVKSTARVGDIDITAIASRQEGESGQATFRGGNQEQSLRIPEWRFIPGKYFFITDPDTAPAPQIVGLRVYMDDRQSHNDTDDGALTANVWINPDPANLQPDEPYVGSFHQLRDDQDYTFDNVDSYSLPVLVLTTPLSPRHVLAVSYRALVDSAGVQVTRDVGSFVTSEGDSVLELKMIRPGEDKWGTDIESDITNSTWAAVRRLEMKNHYYLGATNIDPGSFELQIVRDENGAGGDNPFTITDVENKKETPILEVLGLDQKNNANPNDRTPDGRIDQEYINYEEGVLWFPDLRPFDPSLGDIEGTQYRFRSWPPVLDPDVYARPDTLGWTVGPGGVAVPLSAEKRADETVPGMYDLLPEKLSNTSPDIHKYTLEAVIKSSSANTVQLTTIGAVLEGSETVRLNGQVLDRGTDYTIFYETGTVTLKHPDATAPGADLVITYSYDSPFTQGQQSLLGATVASRPDPGAKLSFSTSWLHESRGSPDRRPRLGQEPRKTTVGDISGRLRLEPWFLTSIADKIPLVDSNAPSRLEVWGAVGMSMPNPNTRGDVYIDDMEGADVAISPAVSRSSWFYSSAPVQAVDYYESGSGQPFVAYDVDPEDRGELLWFSPNNVTVGDLTPREDSEQARNDQVPVLEVIYIPQENPGPNGSWGGLVTPISVGGTDVSESQFLEITVNDYINYNNASQRKGEILIDVGSVSEDAVWDPLTPPVGPNGLLDYEDRNQSGGQYEADEDIGLDNLRSSDEPPTDPTKKRFSTSSPSQDPAGDERREKIETGLPEQTIGQRIAKYGGVNGTEVNQRVDGEDLDGNFQLDRADDYVEYRVDLSAPAFIDVARDNPGVTDPKNGWRRYRIPLDEFHLEEGVPNLSQVKHMRIWFKGIDPGDTLDVQIASVEIVGNRWLAAENLELDQNEVLKVSVVNNKENAEYIEPFEVERINNVKEREQSLSLDFENFSPGKEFLAFRRLLDARNYTLYQSLAYYVQPRFQSIPNDSVEFFIRFGSNAATDTLSYYEVATPVSEMDPRRRGDGWMDFQIDVAELSGLKGGGVRQDSTVASREDIGNGQKVTIRGNPSFSRIWRVSVGLRNISGKTLSEGSVWFDELRMGNVRRDRGWATRAFASVQLADLANFQASVNYNTADFLRLGQVQGSGSENVRYDLRGQIALNKFVENLNLNAPLSLRMSRARNTPKFIPNSDILFSGGETGREISRFVDREASLSLSRSGRGRGSWLTRYTIDGLRVGGSISETFREDVTRADSTFRKSGNLSYGLNLGSIRPLRPLNVISLWPWPRSISMSLARARSERRVWSPVAGSPDSLRLTNNTVTRTGTLNLGASAQPIELVNYTWSSSRDLIDEHFDNPVVRAARPPDSFLGINLGREVQQTHNVAVNYTPPLLGRTLRPRVGWTGGSAKSSNPTMTLETYKDAVFDVNNNNSANLSLTLPLGKLVRALTGAPEAGRPVSPARPDTTGGGGQSDGDDDVRKFFTRVIKFSDIQTSGALSRRSAYSRIKGRPPILYTLGLTRDVGLNTDVFPVEGAPLNRSNGQTVTYRGNTELTLLRYIGVDLGYQKRKDVSRSNNLLGRVKDDTTWPEIRFDWGEVHKRVPLVKKLFSDFRVVGTSFSKVTSTTGTEENPKENITTTTSWRPLLSVSGTLFAGWRMTLNTNLSSSQTTSRRLGSAATSSERSQVNYQLSFSKKFIRSAAGRGKDIDFKLDLSYAKNSSVTRSEYSIPREQKHDQLRINTSTGIRLTKAMAGTFVLELGQERWPVSNRTRRTVRLGFSTGFSF